MALPILLERGSELTLQEQIYRFIRDQVLSGGYPAGLQLPSTRDLAEGLQVSRNTAVLAYQWLESEGYIEMRQRAGTFTRLVISESIEAIPAEGNPSCSRARPSIALQIETPLLVDRDTRRRFDYWYGRIDPREFPSRIWARLVSECLTFARSGLTDYGPQAGHVPLRDAISAWLSTAKGLVADAERILITAGAQDGLNIISRLLIERGTTVAVENPGYRDAAIVFESYGAKVAPTPIDDEGLVPAALRAVSPKLVYVTPSHQFPTGVVMSLERRQHLLAVAEELNCYIIEDDYDGEIIYDRPPLAALAALDRYHRVIYVGTFSKSIGAGLRLGFIVVPPELARWATAIKSVASYGQPWTEQAALTAFIRDGHFRTHLRRIRTLYRTRRDALIAALRQWCGGDVEIGGSGSGLHLLFRVPDHFPPADKIVEIAGRQDVGFYTPQQSGAIFAGGGDPDERRLVLGYAALTPDEIAVSIGRVARAVTAFMAERADV